MTDNLFKKAACLTDIHFGRSGNSPVANEDNLAFLKWFVEEAKTWGAETCIMLGDWHDNRHSLHISTMNYSLEGIQLLNDSFERVWWLPGNHDLFYRDKRDVSSVEFVKHLPNICIVREPITACGVTLLPWLVGDEYKMLKNLKSRYVFSHLELPGFFMNAKVEMPEIPGHPSADDFKKQDYVFSGHFHMRQTKGRVVYTGNIMPFNFADAWDSDRGLMFLEWGKEPIFKAWPDQPLFRTMKLSELINEPAKFLVPKLTARVGLDVDISYEEAQYLKDAFVKDYGLRKIELVHQQKQEADQEFTTDVVYQSVDQIVVDGLMSVQSIGLKPEMLVKIYKGLPSS